MKPKLTFNKGVLKSIEDLKDAKVSVGWFEESKYDDNTSIAEVAQFQEYGTSRGIPQRPFMRPAELHNQNKWKQTGDREIKRCVDKGKPLTEAMARLGFEVKADIQDEIRAVMTPPLAESTIKSRLSRKKSKKITATLTKPLIDTGVMLAAVQSKVENV